MKKIFILSLLAIAFLACNKKDLTPSKRGIQAGNGMVLDVKELEAEKGEMTAKVLETSAPLGSYMVSVVNSDVLFYTSHAGEYTIEVTKGDKSVKKTIKIQPNNNKKSKYITRVLEYMPAPGQFINELPEYKDGDTQEIMNRKALEAIRGENRNNEMISLGAWGGYVIFGFDHSVQNVEGKADLCIEGNAFVANSIGDNLGSKEIMEGSVEPGIVMVSYDRNNNGLADDEWFEILGSGSLTLENESWYSFMKTNYPGIDLTIHRDYEMTYYRPKSEKPRDPNKYIEWYDNKNTKGFMLKNGYHNNPYSYYPKWINSDKMTFKGVKLATNMYRQNGGEGFYLQLAYKYGYVDNVPIGHLNNNIDISWAVDKNGKKVKLPYIDFVKVQTGVYGISHTLGEISTEVLRAMDLHIDPKEDINSSEIVK